MARDVPNAERLSEVRRNGGYDLPDVLQGGNAPRPAIEVNDPGIAAHRARAAAAEEGGLLLAGTHGMKTEPDRHAVRGPQRGGFGDRSGR